METLDGVTPCLGFCSEVTDMWFPSRCFFLMLALIAFVSSLLPFAERCCCLIYIAQVERVAIDIATVVHAHASLIIRKRRRCSRGVTKAMRMKN